MRTLLCSEAVPEREPPRTAPPALPEHVLMQLQRTAGNAAVSRLVAGARGPLTVARCPDCGGTCKDAEEEEEEALERRRPAPQGTIHRAPDATGGTPDCPGYDEGEPTRSHSAAGILAKDVMARGQALLVADFGIDQSTIKAQAKTDADLQAWVAEWEKGSSYRLSILGLDDCVGDRAKREQLRKQRA